MSLFEILSLVFNVVLGGGLLVTVATLKAQRKKANADAKGAEAATESTELDNVDKAVKIWRDLAESMEQRNREISQNLLSEIEVLRKELRTQNSKINKILKILDSVDHDNLEEKIKEAKDVAS